ncbi:MAG: hypothetical protein ABIR62_04515 [Dokdonella sp.]
MKSFVLMEAIDFTYRNATTPVSRRARSCVEIRGPLSWALVPA